MILIIISSPVFNNKYLHTCFSVWWLNFSVITYESTPVTADRLQSKLRPGMKGQWPGGHSEKSNLYLESDVDLF